MTDMNKKSFSSPVINLLKNQARRLQIKMFDPKVYLQKCLKKTTNTKSQTPEESL